VEEFIKRVPEEYRKRWNIESGYRIKNEFRIRTCSRSPVTRTLLFVLQCILHNYLNTLKRELYMTAYQLKSTISEGILNMIKGLKPPRISLREFSVRVSWYNLQRIWELRHALAIV
jgi:IS4 transposase